MTSCCKLLLLAMSLLLLPVCVYALPPALLPQTGQTGCWNSSGVSIPCSNSGQDGDSLSGIAWSSQRFTINNNLSLTDTLTGLAWSKDANPAGAASSWQQALDYIKGLNNRSYLGKNDWRLPNRLELLSLINAQESIPADWLLAHGFANVQQGGYWSATTDALDPSFAWPVFFDSGLSSSDVKADANTSSYFVWPVRGPGTPGSITLQKTGQTTCWDEEGNPLLSCTATGQDGELLAGLEWPAPRFTPDTTTVTDELTGLVWSRNSSPAGAEKGMTWQEALDYVNGLNLGGKDDWRLPNRNELTSIWNHQKNNFLAWLESQGFTNASTTTPYWSSTTNPADPTSATALALANGYLNNNDKSSHNIVWPVRDRDSWKQDSILISVSPKFGISILGGTKPSRQITLQNTGNTVQSVSVSLAGDNPGQFSLTSGGTSPCGSTSPSLAAGKNCTLLLAFTPASTGQKSAMLNVSANGMTNINTSGYSIATIYGKVTNSSDATPVPGATIALNGSSTTAISGADGSFSLGSLAPATYSITVTMPGFATTGKTGLVVSGTTSAVADITIKRLFPAGDVSQNGSVGREDALLVMNAVLGKVPLTAEQKLLADVAPLDPVTKKPKGDGIVDLADAVMILRRAVGAISW